MRYAAEGAPRRGTTIVRPINHMYIVHMKRVTVSQARRHWFRLLDEVAGGEVVVMERNGRTIELRRVQGGARDVPDYSDLIRATADVAAADGWGWDWPGGGGDLTPVEAERR